MPLAGLQVLKTRTYDDVDGENVSRKNEARLKTICSHRISSMGFDVIHDLSSHINQTLRKQKR